MAIEDTTPSLKVHIEKSRQQAGKIIKIKSVVNSYLALFFFLVPENFLYSVNHVF